MKFSDFKYVAGADQEWEKLKGEFLQRADMVRKCREFNRQFPFHLASLREFDLVVCDGGERYATLEEATAAASVDGVTFIFRGKILVRIKTRNKLLDF